MRKRRTARADTEDRPTRKTMKTEKKEMKSCGFAAKPLPLRDNLFPFINFLFPLTFTTIFVPLQQIFLEL
jgi:hypothetical protein